MQRTSTNTRSDDADLASTAALGALATGPSSGSRAGFYVGEPEIPEGMTCAEWRRRTRLVPRPGLFARIRARFGAGVG
jgi:hypothetical protein